MEDKEINTQHKHKKIEKSAGLEMQFLKKT